MLPLFVCVLVCAWVSTAEACLRELTRVCVRGPPPQIPGATFYYEAMDCWRMLLAQRKRWNNGTAAAYLFFLFDRDGLLDFTTAGLAFPRTVQFMWGLQLLQVILVLLSPSFFANALYESTLFFARAFPHSLFAHRVGHFSVPATVSTAYFAVYVLWVLFCGTCSTPPACCGRRRHQFLVDHIVYPAAYVINACAQVIIVGALIVSDTKYGVLPASAPDIPPISWCYPGVGVGTAVGEGDVSAQSMSIVFKMAVFVWVMPIALAATVSFQSAGRALLYVFPFLLSLSMYVCFVPASALSRLQDLSWGNRAATLEGVDKKKEGDFARTSLKVNAGVVALNLAIYAIYRESWGWVCVCVCVCACVTACVLCACSPIPACVCVHSCPCHGVSPSPLAHDPVRRRHLPAGGGTDGVGNLLRCDSCVKHHASDDCGVAVHHRAVRRA